MEDYSYERGLRAFRRFVNTDGATRSTEKSSPCWHLALQSEYLRCMKLNLNVVLTARMIVAGSWRRFGERGVT
ncbi:hypothetical protein TSAR_005760 [Trichomalopsis sarcophagae]|uniref:Uncharacterized protein n=1 Tax=Trichomalopsis sarcophagae TaxID=543379 RepID=A0A232FKM9_9HYME|nr:hypothetical protein TSAR_005760 [Trichomalopsis sarcophagae]